MDQFLGSRSRLTPLGAPWSSLRGRKGYGRAMRTERIYQRPFSAAVEPRRPQTSLRPLQSGSISIAYSFPT